ncbi:cytochrome b561 domain-containing protein [Jannaschia donghaensis]|uniref:Eukaryotic cytochrome b561 n=1 Tax=Jannaschia donghaensis TaxID=420998 RepID=A0A0M6YLG7_9RHOB|nr:cytochrome b561 domain-containing protein [Jannaschia donghaensis]CTQ51201.1 Eukaryotic cytochrome b561 [Jannaschia donghaensis]
MWEWLLQPIDASRPHDLGLVISLHGRIMMFAWGVIVPLAVLIARYLKVIPGQDFPSKTDSQIWWNIHRIGQLAAVMMMLVGVILILRSPGADSTTGTLWLHSWLGWTIFSFGVVQAASGFLRGSKGGPTDPHGIRGDHYDMTVRRIVFEVVHKGLGYGVLAMGAITILTGMWQANGPIWMWIGVLLWWSLLLAIAYLLQKLGMAMNSYRAIWGPGTPQPRYQPRGSSPDGDAT